MHLLRNSGRYRQDQYEVVSNATVPVALTLLGGECQLVLYQVDTGQSDAAGRLPLPGRTKQWRFGEFTLALNLPEVQCGEAGYSFPYEWCLEADLSFPVRGVAGVKEHRPTQPPEVARDFCDFLTVATGHYVAVAAPGTSPIERRCDRPRAPLYAHRPPLNAGYFDLANVNRYIVQFDRFASRLHWRHHAALLNAFRCYRLALGLSQLSLSTAYFLLVSALEAIAAEFVDAEVSFEDFGDDFRKAFQCWQDERGIACEDAADLRRRLALADRGRLRSRRRFRTVVSRYLPGEFWTCHANGAVTPETLDKHLIAVYDTRCTFAHKAREFGIEASVPGLDVVPAYAYDLVTGREKDKLQGVLTLDYFAWLTRDVLLGVLEADHPATPNDDPDPEDWMRGRTYLRLGEDLVPASQEEPA